jgi:hypothetical protein
LQNHDERKKYMKTVSKFISLALAVVVVAMGAVTAQGAPNDLFVSVNGPAMNFGGSISQYTPNGVQSIFASLLSHPRGVPFDHFGNLFVATNTIDPNTRNVSSAILKIFADGTRITFANINFPTASFFASEMKFDNAGNLFVTVGDLTHPNIGASEIYKFTPNGAQSTFGSAPGQVFGLAFDSVGNLFAGDFVDQTIYKFTPDGTRSVFADPSAFDPDSGPVGLAFDSFGNLFVSTQSNGLEPDTIRKFTPDGTESTFATGLNFPKGLAFDRAGNLFVAENVQTGPGDILKFTPHGNMTVFASGIGSQGNDGPEWLAVQPLTPRPLPTPHPRPHVGR